MQYAGDTVPRMDRSVGRVLAADNFYLFYFANCLYVKVLVCIAVVSVECVTLINFFILHRV